MKKVINTDKAPAAIGPYVQAIAVNSLLYTSGQLPIDSQTGEMPETIEEQTKISLNNVKSILEEAGSSMVNVVKTTVFLKNMDHFTAMNEVYESFFAEGSYPARSAIQVAKLPKDALVEIEAVAVITDKE